MLTIKNKKNGNVLTVHEDEWNNLKEMGFSKSWAVIAADKPEDEARAVAKAQATKAIPKQILDFKEQQAQAADLPDEAAQEDPPDIPGTEAELRERLDAMGVTAPANYRVKGLTKLYLKHINT